MLQPGAHVIALYNGIEEEDRKPEPIDSLTVIHLGEHLERLSSRDLRQLDTQVPLETLRAVVDLATEIGREGREGKPVGTMLVVGTRGLGWHAEIPLPPEGGTVDSAGDAAAWKHEPNQFQRVNLARAFTDQAKE